MNNLQKLMVIAITLLLPALFTWIQHYKIKLEWRFKIHIFRRKRQIKQPPPTIPEETSEKKELIGNTKTLLLNQTDLTDQPAYQSIVQRKQEEQEVIEIPLGPILPELPEEEDLYFPDDIPSDVQPGIEDMEEYNKAMNDDLVEEDEEFPSQTLGDREINQLSDALVKENPNREDAERAGATLVKLEHTDLFDFLVTQSEHQERINQFIQAHLASGSKKGKDISGNGFNVKNYLP